MAVVCLILRPPNYSLENTDFYARKGIQVDQIFYLTFMNTSALGGRFALY